MQMLLRWAVTAVVFYAIAWFMPGIAVDSWVTTIWLALLWGVVNVLIKPILVLLTLPINLLTLGLFTLVINALLFWFLAVLVDGFSVDGFMTAFWGAILLSIALWLTEKVGGEKK